MSTPPDERDETLQERARELYFAAVEAADGGLVDVELLCARHPDVASQLRALAIHAKRARDALSSVGAERHDSTFLAGVERYEVLRQIAAGGMGVILEVRDHNLHRLLAMKVLHRTPDGDDPTRSARRRSRLLNEAEILGQLDHPSIVTVVDVGCFDDGALFFTMQLVRGGSFRDVVNSVHGDDAEWTLHRAIDIVARVCDALAHAHARGVLHRDIKSDNVMVGAFGEVYVMDWGLAKAEGIETTPADLRFSEDRSPTATPDHESVHTERRDSDASPLVTLDGDVIGTPAFMSPEQAAGRVAALGPASDVYSLGAMLYHLLAGHAPHDSGDAQTPPRHVLARVLDGPPPPLDAAVHHELAAICRKAMERDVAERYATPRMMAADLRAWLEGRVVSAHRTGAWVEMTKWVARHRAIAAAALVALLAVVGLGVSQAVFADELEELNAELTGANDELVGLTQEQASDIYERSMVLAGDAYAKGRRLDAVDHLRQASYEMRGWEWAYLDRMLSTQDRVVPIDPAEEVFSIDWSPDGAWLSASTRESRVDAQSEVVVYSTADFSKPYFRGNIELGSRSVTFLPDSRLVCVDFAGLAHVWHVLERRRLRQFSVGREGAVWSDGEVLRVSPEGHPPMLFDIATGVRLDDPIIVGPNAFVTGPFTDFTRTVGFRFPLPLKIPSADGSSVLVVHDDWTVSVLDGLTGETVARHNDPVPEFRHIRLSPDRKSLSLDATSGDCVLVMLGGPTTVVDVNRGATIFAWRPSANEVLVSGGFARLVPMDDPRDPGLRLPATALAAISPDGSLLASSYFGASKDGAPAESGFELWNVDRADRRDSVQVANTHVRDIDVTPDERLIAAATLTPEIVFVDVEERAIVARHPLDRGAFSVRWHASGERLAVGLADGWVREYNAVPFEEIRGGKPVRGRIEGLEYFADGHSVVVTGNGPEVARYDFTAGRNIWHLEKPGWRFTRAAVSPDQTLVACTDTYIPGTLLIDAKTGEIRREWMFDEPQGDVLFIDEGRRLLINHGTAVARHSIWNLETDVWDVESRRGSVLVITPDGRRFLGRGDGGLTVHDAGSSALLLRTQDPESSLPEWVSKDGMLVLGRSFTGYIRWWDARPWEPRLR